VPFLTTNLVQRILSKTGQVEPTFGLFDVTGGSATTFINTNFTNFENPPESDTLKNYLAIVVRDAAGASASPEGKWGIVSAYDDATQTGTIATVTDAIASGDTIMLAKQDKFPLSQILFSINTALEELGDLPNNADVSLTTVANQTEYSVPVAVKRGIKQVWVQGRTNDVDDNQWFQITDYRNELTGAGTASVLYLPVLPSGRTIRLVYDGVHPVVSAYSSVINEYVHPNVIVGKSILTLLEWYNRRDENQESDSYFLWLEKEYREKYIPQALAENPIKQERKTARFFSKGNRKTVDRPPSPFL
jgi:hypothetical protein